MPKLQVNDLIPVSHYVSTTKRITLREWIDYVGISLRGQPYSTEKHEYLDAILADTSPIQVFRKGAQVAISTTVLLKSMYVAEHLGKKVVYYFQSDSAVSDFSNDRCQPMLETSPYLMGRLGSTVNVQLKHLGPGAIYFRGLMTRGAAKSIDADMMIADELDEAPEANYHFAFDRLMHSDLQWAHSLSQPSVPGFGIDKQFEDTDQQYWNLICPSCGYYNCLELNWPSNFVPIARAKKKTFADRATHYRGCLKCHSRLNPAQGAWVAKYPNRFKRGYHLSQLFTQIKPLEYPNVATKIMQEYETYKTTQLRLERFVISVLGFPFAGGNARVDDNLLDFCEGESTFLFRASGCFMGVDQGDRLSIAIGQIVGGRLFCVSFEETEAWDRLDYLMDAFGVQHCVIDAMPNKHSAKSFASRHPGRVSIQYFTGKTLKRNEELFENRVMVPTVTIDRTDSLDALIDKMEGGLVVLPSRSKSDAKRLGVINDVRRHLKNLIAKVEQTPSGVVKRVYLKGGVENHYGMALNSACIAAFDLGVVDPGPMVLPVFTKFGGGRA